mmetsp:Transcript_20476/g.52124  ORF Transcript_20476/g.52124 Transcript_20476/m.52124 type:complete len:349 (+) Transcript_20476:1547-2593(+)
MDTSLDDDEPPRPGSPEPPLSAAEPIPVLSPVLGISKLPLRPLDPAELKEAPLAGPTTPAVLVWLSALTPGAPKPPKPARPPKPPTTPREEGAEATGPPAASPSACGGPTASPKGEKLMLTFGRRARKPCCQSSFCFTTGGSKGASSLMPPREARAEFPLEGVLATFSSSVELLKNRAKRELPGRVASSSSGSSVTSPFSRSSKLPIIDHGSESPPVGCPERRPLPRGGCTAARMPGAPAPTAPIAPIAPAPMCPPSAIRSFIDATEAGPGARHEGTSGSGMVGGGAGGGPPTAVTAATPMDDEECCTAGPPCAASQLVGRSWLVPTCSGPCPAMPAAGSRGPRSVAA